MQRAFYHCMKKSVQVCMFGKDVHLLLILLTAGHRLGPSDSEASCPSNLCHINVLLLSGMV